MLPCCKYATPQEQSRLRKQATNETLTLHATSTETKEPTNPWNAFQQRYGGYQLKQPEFPIFYKWEPRKDLEGTIPDKEIVSQFLALQRTTTSDTTTQDEWDVVPDQQ